MIEDPHEFKGTLVGLRPRASGLQRRSLLKHGLVYWSRRPGHRFKSLKLTAKGYAWRKELGLEEPVR